MRKIFELYLSGLSIVAIKRELEKCGLKSPSGKDTWSKRSIEIILSNEKYTGEVLIGKSFSLEYPYIKRRANFGEQVKYISENNHSPNGNKIRKSSH